MSQQFVSSTKSGGGKNNKAKQANKQQAQTASIDLAVSTGSHRSVTQASHVPSMTESALVSHLQSTSPPPANANQIRNSRLFHSLDNLGKDGKDEQFHIKTARTFFFLQNMGSECRVFMLKSYKNPRTPRKRTRHERTVFEGIFQAFSANMGELMLHASEEKLLDMKTGEERTVGIYTEPIVLRMETVAQVKFIGKNITRNGLVSVEPTEDVPFKAAHRSVTYKQSRTVTQVESGEVEHKSTGLQKSEVDIGALSLDDAEFPPFESSHTAANRHSEPSRKQKSEAGEEEQAADVELPSVDEILASKLRQSSVYTKSMSKEESQRTTHNDKLDKKKQRVTNQLFLRPKSTRRDAHVHSYCNIENDQRAEIREQVYKTPKQLQKFKFDDAVDQRATESRTLEELGAADQESLPFDQFKGRVSDFDMDLYSVKMPAYVSPQLQAHADQIERDIAQKSRNGQAEDDAILAIDNGNADGQRLIRRQRNTAATEEQLYGTAVPEGYRADETAFSRDQAQAETFDSQPAKKASIKELLAFSLAANEGDDEGDKNIEGGLQVPGVASAEAMRSRNNSLHNGETSKVIENLDIEQRKLDKEQIEQYLRFKAMKNLQSQQASGVAPRDRKMSQEYFKEEAKRLDKKLQEGKHLGKSQLNQQTNKEVEEPQQVKKIENVPKKRFTCFKQKSTLLVHVSVPQAFGLYDKIQSEM